MCNNALCFFLINLIECQSFCWETFGVLRKVMIKGEIGFNEQLFFITSQTYM